MTAGERAYVKIHPGVVRATHWINAVAMAIMIGSGWRIWNSDPIFDFSFPVAITIGGDPAMSQDVHNELGLAGALQWHFAGMWLLLVNGLVYFAYGIWSGHFRHSLFPLTPSAFVRDALAALTFRLPHRLGIYNAVQKTLYLGVLAVERGGWFGLGGRRCLGLSGRFLLSASGLFSHVSSHSLACTAYQGTGGKNQAGRPEHAM